jgi:tRNA A-37 threonylcarbamoyl transferase component Bud32
MERQPIKPLVNLNDLPIFRRAPSLVPPSKTEDTENIPTQYVQFPSFKPLIRPITPISFRAPSPVPFSPINQTSYISQTPQFIRAPLITRPVNTQPFIQMPRPPSPASRSPIPAPRAQSPFLLRPNNYQPSIRTNLAVRPPTPVSTGSQIRSRSKCLTDTLYGLPTALRKVFELLPHPNTGSFDIGEGAYAKIRLVKLIQSNSTNEKYAIKSVAKKPIADRLLVPQMKLEIQAQSELSIHPNIVSLYDFYEEPTHIHLVLEYCNYGPLGNKVISSSWIPLIASQILSAIDFIHKNNFIHRDITPMNVLITISTNSPVFKLADFGWVAYIDPKIGYIKTGKAGTPGFMAPEIEQERPHSFPCDIYSFGRLMLFCANKMLCNDFTHVRSLDKIPSLRPSIAELTKDTWK